MEKTISLKGLKIAYLKHLLKPIRHNHKVKNRHCAPFGVLAMESRDKVDVTNEREVRDWAYKTFGHNQARYFSKGWNGQRGPDLSQDDFRDSLRWYLLGWQAATLIMGIDEE